MRGNKGLSNMVGYVLLIVITISLSMMVYGWLKFYAEDSDVETCSDRVNLVIDSYRCYSSNTSLEVTFKNKGFFGVDGFVVRVHDRPGADFGFYVLDDKVISLAPGEVYGDVYDFSSTGITDVTIVDIQPFLNGSSGKVSCESYNSQRVVCS